MEEIISILVYSSIGIILMMLGTFLVDLIIPCHFPSEIKKGNQAVGYLTAGSSIAVGIVLKAAIMTITIGDGNGTLLAGIGNTFFYFAIGIVLCLAGYLVLNMANRRYDLNKEIGDGNSAAGLMVMGMFIGIAIVISGVII